MKTGETESAYADFYDDPRTLEVLDLCRRLLIAAGLHPDIGNYENSDGEKRGTPRSQSFDGKVIEVDGEKYQLKEL